MSLLEPLLEQPFRDAPNRGFHLLLACGVGLLVLAALVGRHPVVEAATIGYLLSIPTFVGYRIRTWNEALASVDTPGGREEAAVVGLDEQGAEEDERDDDEDEQGDAVAGTDDGRADDETSN